MRKLQIGGAFGLFLSAQEYRDILECVEAYCMGATSPEVDVDPAISHEYPGQRFTSPVPERYWSLHARLATKAPPRAPTIESSENGG